MCGIAGFIGNTQKSTLEKMLVQIRHRGPDGQGIYYSPQAGLANARLAIIDLVGGSQPQTNEDQNLVITYNGEIYNFLEVRTLLLKKGHKFKTQSDTEVILHAYEEYGTKCLAKFNGMFAFAIWNKSQKTLFAARDRLGIKPFFYTHTPNNFLFASEIKSLLKHPEVKKEVDFDQIYKYLVFRYVPEPQTIFKNIFHLPAAHFLIYKDQKLSLHKYWEIPETGNFIQNEEQAAQKLFSLLKDSVQLRQISDVPIASYLSGGVDSSLITALAATYNPRLSTFITSFSQKKYDESDNARKVSEGLSLSPHLIKVNGKDTSDLPSIIWHLDQPLADAAVLPMFQMAKKTKEKASVVLSGDGADEIFAGYERYMRLINGRFLSGLFSFQKLLPENLINILSSTNNLFSNKSNKFNQYLSQVSVFSQEEAQNLLGKGKRSSAVLQQTQNQMEKIFSSSEDFLTQMQKFDLMFWLTGDILLKTDRMTMAYGVEARVPFLDHRLVEFSFRLSPQLKLRLFSDKYVERQAALQILPQEVAFREKHGFDVPLEIFKKDIKKYLSVKNIKKRGWFNNQAVKTLRANIDDRQSLNKSFSLMILEIWAQKYLDEV